MSTQANQEAVLMTNILSPIASQTDGIGVIRNNASTTANGSRAHDGVVAVSNGDVAHVLDRSLLVEYFDDFLGNSIYPITADGAQGPLYIKDTSSSGTPTYAVLDDAKDGQLKIAFDNTNEAQIVTLFFNNLNNINTNQEPVLIYRLMVNQTMNSNSKLAFGFASDQNDTTDSVTYNAWFHLDGSNALVLESDDNTTDTDDKAPDTAVTLTASTFYEFKVSMSALDGASATNVKFFYRSTLGGDWTALTVGGTTFKILANTDVQPFLQFQKAANAETDSITLDYIRCYWKRAA